MKDYLCRPVSLADRDAVGTIRLRAGHTSSSHAFVSLYLWQRAMGLSLCLTPDAFFVRIAERGENAWMFPCGAARAKLDFLQAMADTPGFSLHYLRQEDVDFLEEQLPGRFRFSGARGDSEYLYRRATQLEMPGKSFKKLRTKVRHAITNDTWQVVELDRVSMKDALEVLYEWREQRDSPGDLPEAILALEEHTALGLRGILLRNAAGVQALAMGSVISPGVLDLHVAKTLLPGLDTYLKWELYRHLPDSIVWINQEEDLDLPGLRTHKLEAMPDQLVNLWKGVPME